MHSNYEPYDVIKAAKYLCITKKALYNLVSLKKISCYRPTGKLLRFSREDLDAYTFRNRTAAEEEIHEKAEDLLLQRTQEK